MVITYSKLMLKFPCTKRYFTDIIYIKNGQTVSYKVISTYSFPIKPLESRNQK